MIHDRDPVRPAFEARQVAPRDGLEDVERGAVALGKIRAIDRRGVGKRRALDGLVGAASVLAGIGQSVVVAGVAGRGAEERLEFEELVPVAFREGMRAFGLVHHGSFR